jgi:hypothetical protein
VPLLFQDRNLNSPLVGLGKKKVRPPLVKLGLAENSNMILDYREADSAESYNDTILRMLNRKTQIIMEQSERIKQLEYETQHLIPTDASSSLSTSHIDERNAIRMSTI